MRASPCIYPLKTLACPCSTSPPIHLAKLMGLVPGTTYYYTVGDGTNMSPEYSFTTLATALPAAGAVTFNAALLEIALGTSQPQLCALTRTATHCMFCSLHRRKQRCHHMAGL